MQKFLFVCVVIIMIVVVIVGIVGLMQQHVVENNRKAITSDLHNFAQQALTFFNTPLYLGGGEGLWVPQIDGEYQDNRCRLWLQLAGFEQKENSDAFITNNGTFKMWINSYEDKILKFEGTGLEIGDDGVNPVKLRMDVNGSVRGILIKTIN